MTSLNSIVRSIFVSLGVTVWIARFVFVAFLCVLIAYIYLIYTSAEVTGSVGVDVTYLLLLIPVAVTAGFAWLGFSSKGQTLLANRKSTQDKSKGGARILKVLFASYGMAVGVWGLLIALALGVIHDASLVEKLFEPWPLIILTALALPIAYKWLK